MCKSETEMKKVEDKMNKKKWCSLKIVYFTLNWGTQKRDDQIDTSIEKLNKTSICMSEITMAT